jgi:small multidrug resistance pump
LGPWALLSFAIASEVVGTTALRASNDWDGGKRLLGYAIVFVGYALSFWLLALVLRKLDLGIAYAVWAGVGTAITAVIGVALFGEAVTAVKVGCILLIIGGVVGLNLSGAHH